MRVPQLDALPNAGAADSLIAFGSSRDADPPTVRQPLAMLFRKQPEPAVLRCSFCNKSQRDVRTLYGWK
jgi:hypothetical protein